MWLQWGQTKNHYYTEKNGNVVFPLSIATIFALNITSKNLDSAFCTKLTEITNSQFNEWNYQGYRGSFWILVAIQQWGVTEHISGNASKIVSFPLAYTTFSHWVANSRSSSTNESSWCTGGYNGTLTGFTARSNGTEIEWIATGLQQWGEVDFAIRTSQFPIAFTSTPYQVISSIKNTTYNKVFAPIYISCNNINEQGFSLPTSVNEIGGLKTWVAIGKQQWGYNSNGGSGVSTSFPISFSSTCYGVVHCSGNTGRIEGNPYITSITTTTIKWGQYGLGYYFALGVQQWGQCYGYKSSKLTNFPISFTTTKFIEIAGTTYMNEFFEAPMCSLRFDDSLTTIRTGVKGCTTSTIGVGTYIVLGIQQWGQCYGYQSSKVTDFPIAFSSTKYIEVTGSTYASELLGMPVCSKRFDTSLTQIRTGAKGGSTSSVGVGTYIVLGMQQWGCKASAGETTSVTFPISFVSACYMVLGNMSCPTNQGYESNVYPKHTWSISSFVMYTRNTTSSEFTWVAVGKQQWGIWNDNRSAELIQCTFPVSNTKETLAILATYFDNTDVSNDAILIKEITLSACKIKLWSSTKISFWVIWLLICKLVTNCCPKSIYCCRT